jgi:hypothetical protein
MQKMLNNVDMDPGMKFFNSWNLLALVIGLGLLVFGSFYYRAPDWDIPISIIMAGFAYLSAANSLQTIVMRRWRRFPLMLLATWWTVDGCYSVYWYLTDPVALDAMRDANWPASLALYWTCGLVWFIPNIRMKDPI